MPIVTGVAGTADADGRLLTARGVPGSVARVRVTLPDGRVRRHVVVFAADGLLTAVGGTRYELGLYTGLSATPDGLALDATWPRSREAYRALERIRLWVDVPPGTAVRFELDGRDYPVAAGVPVVDLGPGAQLPGLRGEAPMRLHVEMRGVGIEDYRGVHLLDPPARTTDEFTCIELPDSALLDAVVDAPGDGEVGPGLSTAGLLLANRLRPAPAGAVYEADVALGCDGVRASLYRRADPGDRMPAVVLVHGGGWSGGDRGYCYRFMHHFAEQGFVTLNLDYRLHPDVTWRTSLDDVRTALAWVRDNAGRLGVDPRRIALCGASAGGHLAALAAFTAPESVAALVLLYPAVDLAATFASWGALADGLAADYFGGELDAASPIRCARAGCPPTLTMIGAEDEMIPRSTVERLHEALDAGGVPNRLSLYAGAAHGFDFFEAGGEAAIDEATAFLTQVFGRTR